jgi:hypothetical protein
LVAWLNMMSRFHLLGVKVTRAQGDDPWMISGPTPDVGPWLENAFSWCVYNYIYTITVYNCWVYGSYNHSNN